MAEGSGFIYDNDGHIVTNNHVVENASEITVYFYNGMWAKADVVATDPASDLALLKVTPPAGLQWQPLVLGSDDALRAGYYVVAMGSPFGLDETMTLGVVSALDRSMPTGDVATGSSYSLPDVIQTDTAINPGNSGGPLLNLKGEVVGVNFAINSPVRANAGVGFAIPVSVLNKVVPALINEGKYPYSYLGISGQTIDATVAAENDVVENTLGVYVGDVVSGGPAEDAGVQAGDIITAIDDQPVVRFEDLVSHLFNATTPNSTATLTVLRDGETLTLDVTVTERPAPRAEELASGEERESGISIADAIKAAKAAVAESELIQNVESATAKRDTQDGKDVWVVTLSGDDHTATVVVDAASGDVLQLDLN
jgi:2-alkenal reductase